MEERLGIPKFEFLFLEHPVNFRGKDVEMKIKIGFSRLGETQIEFIQWLEGDYMYSEFLNAGKEGMHHFGVYVEELEPYVEKMIKAGFEIIQSGQIATQKFAYFDTTDVLGVMLELIQVTKKRTRRNREK